MLLGNADKQKPTDWKGKPSLPCFLPTVKKRNKPLSCNREAIMCAEQIMHKQCLWAYYSEKLRPVKYYFKHAVKLQLNCVPPIRYLK